MTDHRTLLEPIIREVGVRQTARHADMPFSTIANWLRGIRPMSRDNARRIVTALRAHYRQRLRELPRI